MSERPLDWFDRLELELRAAHERPARRGWAYVPRVRAVAGVALAIAAVAIALVPVLAALGGRDGEQAPGRPPAVGGLDSTVVATGTAPEAGPWRLETYVSERLADPESGEEYQPAGLRCLGIALADPPEEVMSTFAGQCGEFPRTPGFSRLQLTVPDASGEAREVLVYGRAPEGAAGVVITPPDGGSPIEAELHEGPPGVPGDFYLRALEPGQAVEGARVNWIDAAGNEGSRGIELLPR
jgi:hypothetical protein